MTVHDSIMFCRGLDHTDGTSRRFPGLVGTRLFPGLVGAPLFPGLVGARLFPGLVGDRLFPRRVGARLFPELVGARRFFSSEPVCFRDWSESAEGSLLVFYKSKPPCNSVPGVFSTNMAISAVRAYKTNSFRRKNMK